MWPLANPAQQFRKSMPKNIFTFGQRFFFLFLGLLCEILALRVCFSRTVLFSLAKPQFFFSKIAVYEKNGEENIFAYTVHICKTKKKGDWITLQISDLSISMACSHLMCIIHYRVILKMRCHCHRKCRCCCRCRYHCVLMFSSILLIV